VSVAIRAGRRNIEIARPDKPLFGSGVTKRELATYYERVASAMLPHLARRPLNLERYPQGIDGPRIFQQHAANNTPSWVRRVEVPGRARPVEHVVAGDAATLVYLAGQACITFHRWLSRSDMLDRPDLLVIDLDPSAVRPAEIRRAARIIGALLRELGLEPWAMTTGSRGYHVAVALRRRRGFDAVREFARGLAELAVAREPGVFTSEQRKAKREGKILVDIQRNAYAHSAVSPYAVRARPDAPVATPLHWEELEDPKTTAVRWTLESVPGRLERDGDPWKDIARHGQTLARAQRSLSGALAESLRPSRRPRRARA
jgi:bifunctional non-homologous end joining protein LigD